MKDDKSGKVRLTMIGPMPPPFHGQTIAMSYMVSEISPHFPQMRVADTSEGVAHGWFGAVTKLRRSATSWWSVRNADVVYIAVKADLGMWLTTVAAGLARLTRARLFLHHHTYGYIEERKWRMIALVTAAGPRARHIVLSKSMARQMCAVMPEVSEPFIVGNAGLIDRTLTELPLRDASTELVLGHLGELSSAKGISSVVDLALALHEAGARIRLVVGGPTTDEDSREQLDRAANELGGLFEYRGLLTGDSKRSFFQEITHFIFPSRLQEAVPLVLYEAMAAGAVCVATPQGSIPEQLAGSPCLITKSADSFVDDALPFLLGTSVSTAASRACREVYHKALRESQQQLNSLVDLFASD